MYCILLTQFSRGSVNLLYWCINVLIPWVGQCLHCVLAERHLLFRDKSCMISRDKGRRMCLHDLALIQSPGHSLGRVQLWILTKGFGYITEPSRRILSQSFQLSPFPAPSQASSTPVPAPHFSLSTSNSGDKCNFIASFSAHHFWNHHQLMQGPGTEN